MHELGPALEPGILRLVQTSDAYARSEARVVVRAERTTEVAFTLQRR